MSVMLSARLSCSALALAAACGGSTAPPADPATPPPSPAEAAQASPAAAAPAGGDRPHFSTFDLEDNALVLPGPIAFKADGELDAAASAQALWFIHDYLEAKPYITLVRIEGHGDQAGQDAVMQSGDRALAVGRWLVAQGITCDRMLAAAFGNLKPTADGSTPEGRAKNRRIEVVNAQLKGRPIGGMPLDGSAPASVHVCD
jgi:outer membrane protein OmpA-like peptidoglycan-associated protein